MYAWIAGWGVYLKCGQLVFPVATKYSTGDNMMLSFTSNVIVPLLFGGSCTESGYVLILKGVLTYVVEDHRENDRRHVVTDIHFLVQDRKWKTFSFKYVLEWKPSTHRRSFISFGTLERVREKKMILSVYSCEHNCYTANHCSLKSYFRMSLKLIHDYCHISLCKSY